MQPTEDTPSTIATHQDAAEEQTRVRKSTSAHVEIRLRGGLRGTLLAPAINSVTSQVDGREPRSTDPAVSSLAAVDRFRAKSRLPLIQRWLTGHSSRTAHYRYYPGPLLYRNNNYCCLLLHVARFSPTPLHDHWFLIHPVAFSRSRRGRDSGLTGDFSRNLLPMTRYRPKLSAPFVRATFVSNWKSYVRVDATMIPRAGGWYAGSEDLWLGAINMSGKLIGTLDAFHVLCYVIERDCQFVFQSCFGRVEEGGEDRLLLLTRVRLLRTVLVIRANWQRIGIFIYLWQNRFRLYHCSPFISYRYLERMNWCYFIEKLINI